MGSRICNSCLVAYVKIGVCEIPVAACSGWALSMIFVRSSLDSGAPNVRLNTECVRWISCLSYVGHLCELVPTGRVCDLIT